MYENVFFYIYWGLAVNDIVLTMVWKYLLKIDNFIRDLFVIFSSIVYSKPKITTLGTFC